MLGSIVRILYRADKLTLDVDGGSPKRRPHTKDDHDALQALADRYGHMVKVGQLSGLIDLGQQIHDWLNGDQKDWLASFAIGTGPRSVELAIEDTDFDDPIARTFLDVPWEVMANEQGFLAGDTERPLVISRRIGKAGTAFAPSHRDILLMFVAAQPAGVKELDIDREEAGILEATARLPLHLRVEESGCLEFLTPRMTLEAPIEALHLSCHGTISNGEPVLLLEDARGRRRPTAPAELVRSLGETKPPLIFLSACRTAEQEATSPSLAMRLIRSGVANVIGWDGSVYDISASSFARELYGELGRCQSVPHAAAMARLALLQTWQSDPNQAEGRHWHLARVYLGEAGGGTIAAAGKKNRKLPKNAGFREFLDKERKQLPVASARTFVGRRRKVQEVLRAFDDQAICGVLIHGMGQLGKSSLAAKIANRMPGHKPVVIFKHYHADQVWDRVLAALPPRASRRLRQDWDVAAIAETFDWALKDALESNDGQPLLLIIDDLEQILVDPKPGQNVLVEPTYRAMLGAVLKAFDATDSESRLLLTSRYRFILTDDDSNNLAAGLYNLPLPEMSPSDRQRQLRAEREQQEEKAEPDTTDDHVRQEELFERAVAAAKGNPGLQSLLTGQVIPDPDLAEEAISAVELFHEEDAKPGQGDLGEFFQKLTLEIYQKALTVSETSQLSAGLVFEQAVPRAIMSIAGEASGVEASGAAIDRLIGLGLLDVIGSGDQILLSVNAFARPLFGVLSDNDRKHLARAVAEPLADAYRDEDGGLPVAERTLEIARLAKLAGNLPELHGQAAFSSSIWLHKLCGLAAPALTIANSALEAMLASGKRLDPHMVRLAIECAGDVGDFKLQDRWLNHGFGDEADACALAMIQVLRSHRDIERGEINKAELGLREAAEIFKASDDERAIAVTQGKIADILEKRGELDEAYRIRAEEVIPVLARLGDVRSSAITLAKIADAFRKKGELNEAYHTLTEKVLPVFTRLGQVRSIAITRGQIADILEERGELDEAYRIRTEEELPAYTKLGDVLGIAVTQGKIAKILEERGELDDAYRIRTEEQLPVLIELGNLHSSAKAWRKIADILFKKGELDEAYRIRTEEELPVFARLGDALEIAITRGRIADILEERGELDEAYRIRTEEALPVFTELGDVRSIASMRGQIAKILIRRGELDEAYRILTEEVLPDLTELGDARLSAIMRGRAAEILEERGELDEAYRILTEEQLPAYTKLGDLGAIAVTQGKIAGIQHTREEFDEAYRIRTEEELPVYIQLGDVRSIAATHWNIALIELAQRKPDAAVPRIDAVYRTFDKLDDAEGLASVGHLFGQILKANDKTDAGRAVLEKTILAYQKLGQTEKAKEVQALLDQIGDES